mgnify:CR=1 FL=1
MTGMRYSSSSASCCCNKLGSNNKKFMTSIPSSLNASEGNFWIKIKKCRLTANCFCFFGGFFNTCFWIFFAFSSLYCYFIASRMVQSVAKFFWLIIVGTVNVLLVLQIIFFLLLNHFELVFFVGATILKILLFIVVYVFY